MRPDKNQIIHILREEKRRLQREGIDAIALFGSFARSEATAYSDVDIAIRKSPDFVQRYGAYRYFDLIADLKERLRQRLHRPVDIFDLDSDSPMREEIKRELIYA
jgi:predicted nucleotidyltransferase